MTEIKNLLPLQAGGFFDMKNYFGEILVMFFFNNKFYCIFVRVFPVTKQGHYRSRRQAGNPGNDECDEYGLDLKSRNYLLCNKNGSQTAKHTRHTMEIMHTAGINAFQCFLDTGLYDSKANYTQYAGNSAQYQ
jgi:hypothetical protein